MKDFPRPGSEVAIIMGSDSDLEIMKNAAKTLEEFKIRCDMTVASAHRSPERAIRIAKTAADRGVKVIIAGAGHAAHLAGVIAAHTVLPVIGVPIDSSPLLGIDSLLSTAQMPPGIPVATVSIGKSGAVNAAVLAAQIIGTHDRDLFDRLCEYKRKLEKKVEEKASIIEQSIRD